MRFTDTLNQISNRHNLSHSDLARYLGVSPQLVYCWYHRGSEPTAIIKHIVRLLALIEQQLPEVHSHLLANLEDWNKDTRPRPDGRALYLERRDALESLRKRLKMDNASLARYLDVPSQTVASWLSGEKASPLHLNRALYLLCLIELFLPDTHRVIVATVRRDQEYLSRNLPKTH